MPPKGAPRRRPVHSSRRQTTVGWRQSRKSSRGESMQGSGTHRTVRSTRTRVRGFTLVELMIVVVIVSILMAIALPSYSLYIKKSRRGDAEATLMDIAQRQQQYLNDARAYAPDVPTLYGGNPNPLPVDVTTYYAVTINAPAGA